MKPRDREPAPRRVVVEDLVDLPDVPPGETYTTTCRPTAPVILSEVLVRDFALDKLVVGILGVTTKERASIVGTRAYRLERQALVMPSMDVSVVLRNETDRPLRVRQASFEEER